MIRCCIWTRSGALHIFAACLSVAVVAVSSRVLRVSNPGVDFADSLRAICLNAEGRQEDGVFSPGLLFLVHLLQLSESEWERWNKKVSVRTMD